MVLSLDLELSWGRFDTLPITVLDAESLEERTSIKRLLALLDRFDIRATWAMVGHLMLDGCARDRDGMAHADITPHARYSWFSYDWYHLDPCTRADLAPTWYGTDILEWIRGARTCHEIASHSFAHIPYGDPECSPAAARADLKAAVEAAAQKGITLESFVFPRNQVGHLEILRSVGLRSYRGRSIRLSEPTYNRWGNSVLLGALGFLDQLLAAPPRQVRAEEVLPGLWNIPGNHFFMPRNGSGKYIPIASRVSKGIKGLDQAVQTGQLYHLWFHPFNLNTDSEAMFSGLERILSYAFQLRKEGRLSILTMGEYAKQLSLEKRPTSEARTSRLVVSR